jgi:glycosyltransferase involved in cell wall biosynthesis
MKEVVHVITTIERGGAEKQLLLLAGLQVASGRKVQVVYLKGEPHLKKEFLDLGVSVVDFKNARFISQFNMFKKLIKMRSVIVHAHLPRAEMLAALSTRRRNFLIVSRHNTEPFFPKAPAFVSRILSRFVLARADAVIAISNAVKKFMYLEKEIKKIAEITVVHYGYQTSKNLFQERNAKFVNNYFVIGTIGRLVPQKDYPTLLRGFAEFNKSYHKSKLIIIGDGKEKQSLTELSLKLGIVDSIEWIGRVNDPDLYLQQMDVFVLASRYEGFGQVLLEAMASDLTIIGANNTAISEVLGKSGGVLFETGDWRALSSTLERVFLNNNKASLGIDPLVRLQEFDPNIMHAKIHSLYEGLGK